MTTTVTIDTHDWPVKAERTNPETGQGDGFPETVPPHSRFSFYVHSTQGLSVTELPIPTEETK